MSATAHDTANELFNRIIGPFSATQVFSLLNEPDNIEERVGVLVQQFNQHPHLILPFKTLIKSIQNQENTSLEEQIRFFQTKHSRNWILVNLINNVLQIKELKLDLESGRLPAKPHDLLKFSHQARIAFGEESRYKDLACAIGLLFDFVLYLQKTSYLDLNGAKFDEVIAQAFTKGVEQGKLIIRLSRHTNNLPNEKLAPMTAMIRQLAQVVLILLYPNVGLEFYKKLAAIRYTEPLKLAMEMKEFGIHSGMVSTYLAQSIPIFEGLGEVMSVWGNPYIAHYTNDHATHELAAIGELGVILKESYQMGDFLESTKVGVFVPELKFMNFILSAEIKMDTKPEGGAS